MFAILCANFLKTEVRPHSFPRPLSAGRNQPRRSGKSFFPRKLVFPFCRVHIEAQPHCPNTWRAEPQKEKCPFLFQRKLVARKSEKQGTFFFLGLPSEARLWRGFRGAYDSIQRHHALRA